LPKNIVILCNIGPWYFRFLWKMQNEKDICNLICRTMSVWPHALVFMGSFASIGPALKVTIRPVFLIIFQFTYVRTFVILHNKHTQNNNHCKRHISVYGAWSSGVASACHRGQWSYGSWDRIPPCYSVVAF
jgi:hypothetical protein